MDAVFCKVPVAVALEALLDLDRLLSRCLASVHIVPSLTPSTTACSAVRLELVNTRTRDVSWFVARRVFRTTLEWGTCCLVSSSAICLSVILLATPVMTNCISACLGFGTRTVAPVMPCWSCCFAVRVFAKIRNPFPLRSS